MRVERSSAADRPKPTVYFHPRVWNTQDTVIVLARQLLTDQGISDYTAWEIPGDTVALLNFSGVTEGSDGFGILAGLHYFFDRAEAREGRIHAYHYTHYFRVRWEGGQWSFDDTATVEHGDGYVLVECADTYFAPPGERPQVCGRGGW